MKNGRSYPTSGYLVHPAFGLRPFSEVALPLHERDLPEEFLALDEDEQDRRVEATITVVFTWAKELGADRVEAHIISTERHVAERAGLRPLHGRFRWAGPLALPEVLQLSSANPQELRVLAGEWLIVYVHETWDSIVVQAPEERVRELSARLDTAR